MPAQRVIRVTYLRDQVLREQRFQVILDQTPAAELTRSTIQEVAVQEIQASLMTEVVLRDLLAL
jgi:hypothetical protein